mgnify:CR=1 FL=1|jgi:hypothetical protein
MTCKPLGYPPRQSAQGGRQLTVMWPGLSEALLRWKVDKRTTGACGYDEKDLEFFEKGR